MSIRDREVLEELRDDAELLAVADAVAETQRLNRRFRPWRAATVVAIAAALFLLVLASPWDRGGGDGLVLDRALASIDTRGPVLHAVISFSDGWRVELATGKTTRRETIAEVWYDKERRLARFVATRDGKALADRTVTGSERELSFALVFPFPLTETAYFREALASGKAKVVGEGTWRQRSVYWLEFVDSESPASLQMGVDSRTYQTVVMRAVDSEGRPTANEIGLLDLEYVPRTKARFGRVDDLGGSFGAGGFSSGGSAGVVGEPPLTPERARTVLGVRAAWAGPTLGDLPLTDIDLQESSYQEEGKPEVRGKQLQLVYGDPGNPRTGRRGRGIEIVEMPAEGGTWAGAAEGPPPPVGFADLTTLNYGDEQGTRISWIATLAVGRIWAKIEAPTREQVLAAARALRPIP
jgi:hypothetical protein